jgi:hypothetical protein
MAGRKQRGALPHCTICGRPLDSLHGMCGGTPSYDSQGRPLFGAADGQPAPRQVYPAIVRQVPEEATDG